MDQIIYTQFITRVVFATLRWIGQNSKAEFYAFDGKNFMLKRGDMDNVVPYLFCEVVLVEGGSWWVPVKEANFQQELKRPKIINTDQPSESPWQKPEFDNTVGIWSNAPAFNLILEGGLERAKRYFLWVPNDDFDEITVPLEFAGKIVDCKDYPFPTTPPPPPDLM